MLDRILRFIPFLTVLLLLAAILYVISISLYFLVILGFMEVVSGVTSSPASFGLLASGVFKVILGCITTTAVIYAPYKAIDYVWNSFMSGIR